jgi:hypothetical protein
MIVYGFSFEQVYRFDEGSSEGATMQSSPWPVRVWISAQQALCESTRCRQADTVQ